MWNRQVIRLHCPAINQKLSNVATAVQDFISDYLEQETEDFIRATADSPELAEWIVGNIKSEAYIARKALLKMIAWVFTGEIIIIILLISLPRFAPVIAILVAIPIWESHALLAYSWRTRNRNYYVTNHIITAIDYGLEYQSYLDGSGELSDGDFPEDARNYFASSIQRAAKRFPSAYGRAGRGGRLLAGVVRKRAVKCRNDILTMIPALATASLEEVQSINDDLALILIRTQLGRWHETDDIVRNGVSIPFRYQVRLRIGEFFRDRSIQVALIAFIGVIASALLRFLPHP